jgi:hypothetical protein
MSSDRPDATPYVRSKPPSEALVRVLNPIVRASLGTPLYRLFPRWMAVLNFAGRRSQKRYRVPAGVHDVDGTPTVFTDRPWRQNFQGGAPLVVTSHGTQRNGWAELVEDRDQIGAALLRAVARTRPANLGIAVAKGHQPTAPELAALGSALIRIRYDDPSHRHG